MAALKLSITRLIREVKKRTPLYDDNMGEFKDMELKAALWNDIAQTLFQKTDTAISEKLKQKWKHLKDAYSRSHRSFMKKKSQGLNPKTPKFNNELSFLQPYIKTRRSRSVRTEDEEADSEDEPLSYNKGRKEMRNGDDPLDFEDNKDALQKSLEIADKSYASSYRLAAVHSSGDVKDRAMLGLSSVIENLNSTEDDEVDTFFRSIAKTVKRLSPLHQALVKKTIVNIVLDVEIRETRLNSLNA